MAETRARGEAARGDAARGTVGRRPGARAWLGVAAVSILGLLVGACGSGGDGAVTVEAGDPAATPAQQLARASEATTEAGSGRMRATAEYHLELDGQEVDATIEMEGAFADGGRRASVTADMSALVQAIADAAGPDAGDVPSSMVMRMIQDGTTMYVRYDSDVPMPGMEGWMSVDLSESGLDTSQLGGGAGLGSGPTGYLDTLRGAGADAVETGRTEIDGVPVTRYEGTIDPQAALDRADPDQRAELESMFEASGMDGTMPFVAWIDDDGVLRRMQLTMEMQVDGMSISMTMTADYYDIGADISIDPPPPGDVTELPFVGGLGSA